jgi:hypothetical protein
MRNAKQKILRLGRESLRRVTAATSTVSFYCPDPTVGCPVNPSPSLVFGCETFNNCPLTQAADTCPKPRF